MTVTPNPNDLPAVLEQLQQAEPDLLRSMLSAFVQALMSADADAACGAEFGARTADRTNRRNCYRSRDGTPGPARSSWRSRSCGRAPTSPKNRRS
jgi:putative transposase